MKYLFLFFWRRVRDSTRATAVAWSLAVTTVHRTVALCRSSFESHSKQKAITADAVMTFSGGELGIRTLGEFPHTAFRAFGIKWNVVELNGTKWYRV